MRSVPSVMMKVRWVMWAESTRRNQQPIALSSRKSSSKRSSKQACMQSLRMFSLWTSMVCRDVGLLQHTTLYAMYDLSTRFE